MVPGCAHRAVGIGWRLGDDVKRVRIADSGLREDQRELVARINAALAKLDPTPRDFTPRIAGTTLGGSGTYTGQFGKFVKVREVVTVWGQLAWNAHTGTGNMRIAGLPFKSTSALQGGAGFRATCALSATSVTFSNQLLGRILENSNEILVASISSGGAVAETAMDTSGALNFTATYLTDEEG